MARAMPKKLRFEILKRDEFKCRYCGRGEGDGVKLHVDHVVAVALGGRNDPENLVTACADCNLGKSARMLDDPRIIGVDFAERKKIFDTAHESLERYREYQKAKERWEYELVSELIRPFKGVFASDPWWGIRDCAETVVWHFDQAPKYDMSEVPPRLVEEYSPYRPLIIEANENAEARVRRSVLYFFQQLGPEAVRDAARKGAEKFVLDQDMDSDTAFRYFCGICHKRIRMNGGPRES